MKIKRIDVTDDTVASTIVAIQRAAYAVEAELMSFDGIPPLHETAKDVQSYEHLTWYGAFVGETLVGLIAWLDQSDLDQNDLDQSDLDQDHTIEIDRLAIDPAWARRGYGRELLRLVPRSNDTKVSTGSANGPAISLYESEGFQPTGSKEIAPGVFTSQFRRDADS